MGSPIIYFTNSQMLQTSLSKILYLRICSGFFPSNQNILYVLHLSYSDNEMNTLYDRPAICTLISWFKSSRLYTSLSVFVPLSSLLDSSLCIHTFYYLFYEYEFLQVWSCVYLYKWVLTILIAFRSNIISVTANIYIQSNQITLFNATSSGIIGTLYVLCNVPAIYQTLEV